MKWRWPWEAKIAPDRRQNPELREAIDRLQAESKRLSETCQMLALELDQTEITVARKHG